MTHLTVQQLSASLDGAVTGPSLELVARHLSACSDCRDRQARLARNDDSLRRLLAPEVSEPFLDDLGTRAEEIAVAIARGVPPPAMTTSTPVLGDEDPYAPSEPPPPERPELGRAGQLAQEAGYGRIGLKPTGSTQPPAADPAEAQRLLEALEHASPAELSEFAAPTGRAPATPDGPVFDMPAWIKDRAAKQRPLPATPREVQKLKLVFEPTLEQVVEPARDRPSEPVRSAPSVTPSPRREPEPTPSPRPEPALAGDPLAGVPLTPLRRVEPVFEIAPPPDVEPAAAAHVGYDDPLEMAAARARSNPEPALYATRRVALSASAQRRRRSARAGMRLHWGLAVASVAGLVLVIVTLQWVPASRDGSSQVATTPRFRLPRVEFVLPDSATAPPAAPSRPELRSASTPTPVEAVVPRLASDTSRAPADSSAVAPADSLGRRNRP